MCLLSLYLSKLQRSGHPFLWGCHDREEPAWSACPLLKSPLSLELMLSCFFGIYLRVERNGIGECQMSEWVVTVCHHFPKEKQRAGSEPHSPLQWSVFQGGSADGPGVSVLSIHFIGRLAPRPLLCLRNSTTGEVRFISEPSLAKLCIGGE